MTWKGEIFQEYNGSPVKKVFREKEIGFLKKKWAKDLLSNFKNPASLNHSLISLAQGTKPLLHITDSLHGKFI